MVGHQAMAPDLDAKLAALLSERIAIEFVVGIVEENGLEAVSALRDIMRQSWNHRARDTGHG
jgi:hypothetical protein